MTGMDDMNFQFSPDWTVAKFKSEVVSAIGGKASKKDDYQFRMFYKWDTDDGTRGEYGWMTSSDDVPKSDNGKKMKTILRNYKLSSFRITLPMHHQFPSTTASSSTGGYGGSVPEFKHGGLSSGYGKLIDKVDPKDTKGFRTFYLQGKLHVATDFGCYMVADTAEEERQWMMTHNFVMLGRSVCIENEETEGLSSHSDFKNEDHDSSEDHDSGEVVETPPLSESENEVDDTKEEMQVIVRNYDTKDLMFSGKVDMSQDVKWLKDYMLDWENVGEEDKMGLILCAKQGGEISEEQSIRDAMKAMKPRTFYLRAKGLLGGASRLTKVKRQEKTKTLQSKVKDLVAEVASLRRDTSMKEVEAVISQFMEQCNNAPIDTIKGFLNSNDIALLQEMDAEIKKSNSGRAEDKFKSVAHLFFGAKMQGLTEQKIAVEKIISTAKASMDFAWSKACEQDEKFSMSVFLALIDKCITFKQGQASGTVPAHMPMQT